MGLAEVAISVVALVASGSCFWLAWRPPERRLERRLNSRVKQLELEWDVTFEKMESLAGRLAKRGALAAKADEKITAIPPRPPITTRAQLLQQSIQQEKTDGESTQPTRNPGE